MARPNQEAIDTFMSITGAPEPVAVQKLEEHGGDCNAAVNAHFSEGDRNMYRIHEASSAVNEDDIMDIDDAVDVVPPRPYQLLPSAARNPLPSNMPSSHLRHGPIIEDDTGPAYLRGPDVPETVVVDGVDQSDSSQHIVRPSAPAFDNVPDTNNDIEEEMIRAAIEASRRDADLSGHQPQHNPLPLEDPELEEAVSLSLKSAAEQEKALHGQGWMVGGSEAGASEPSDVQLGKIAASNGRLEAGSSSIQDDVELQPLVRHRSRHSPSGSLESSQVGVIEASPPSSPGRDVVENLPPRTRSDFASDEWGGMSSVEHDEAVMLEAAMFGGIPDGGYNFAYAPHQFMQGGVSYPRPEPRPPSPSLVSQRILREQQDDEYLAALQADREKAEARRLEEEASRQAALEEETRKEVEARKKMEEEQEFERQMAAKEASLPQEPAADNENAINLMVRMPDGSRRGRRFLKSDRLQSLFDFIDIGRGVKPNTYRLVRPYPRRAYSDGESTLTLNELGLTSKQEALFLESI